MVYCRSQAAAERLLAEIDERLAHCKLQIHPQKSQVVYCKDSNRRQAYPLEQFTFLGFTFKPPVSVSKQGLQFTGFLPAVSRDAMVRMLRTIKAGISRAGTRDSPTPRRPVKATRHSALH